MPRRIAWMSLAALAATACATAPDDSRPTDEEEPSSPVEPALPGSLPPPPDFENVFVAPNVDDDDDDKVVDWADDAVLADDEVYEITVPNDLFAGAGNLVGLAASGDLAHVRIARDGVTLLGAGASAAVCPTIPRDGAKLQVSFGAYAKSATLTFHLLDKNDFSVEEHSIRLVSAPFLMSHHLQKTSKVWVLDAPGWANHNIQMVTRLQVKVGLSTVQLIPQNVNDQWVQDQFETGGLHSDRPPDVNGVLLSPRNGGLRTWVTEAFPMVGFGLLDSGVTTSSTQASFGNLEVTPPVPGHPFGRIYYGNAMEQKVIALLTEQSFAGGLPAQEPLPPLDTSWLSVQHVDEIVTFIPDAGSSKGFKMLFADTAAAYDLLDSLDPGLQIPRYTKKGLRKQGPYGYTPQSLPCGGTGQPPCVWKDMDPVGFDTVGKMAANAALRAANEEIQNDHLDPIRQQMKAALGLSESDILRIPIIFKGHPHHGAVAMTPGTVNLLVVNPEAGNPLLVVPDPFFRQDIGTAYTVGTQTMPAAYDPLNIGDQGSDPWIADFNSRMPPGIHTSFVDDWNLYHVLDGEVHCGTNSLREPPAEKWWEEMTLPPLSPAPWTCGCDPPAFVGTASPVTGGKLDWAALDAELASHDDPMKLGFGVKVPYEPGNGCGSITLDLPAPCEAPEYTDYKIWRMGGAAGILLFPPQLPQYLNEWVHNPGYYAEGMMDPFYSHPAKSVAVACQGLGVGFCAIGSYGSGTDDAAQIPSDLARMDTSPGPMQPGAGAYDGHVRIFAHYKRAAPDPQYPPGYQECFDKVELHAQGGGVQGTCQNDGQDHGAIYLFFKARGSVCQ